MQNQYLYNNAIRNNLYQNLNNNIHDYNNNYFYNNNNINLHHNLDHNLHNNLQHNLQYNLQHNLDHNLQYNLELYHNLDHNLQYNLDHNIYINQLLYRETNRYNSSLSPHANIFVPKINYNICKNITENNYLDLSLLPMINIKDNIHISIKVAEYVLYNT